MRSFILWLVVIYALFQANGILFVAAIIGTLLVDIKSILSEQTPITQQIIEKLMGTTKQENHEKKSDTADTSD